MMFGLLVCFCSSRLPFPFLWRTEAFFPVGNPSCVVWVKISKQICSLTAKVTEVWMYKSTRDNRVPMRFSIYTLKKRGCLFFRVVTCKDNEDPVLPRANLPPPQRSGETEVGVSRAKR